MTPFDTGKPRSALGRGPALGLNWTRALLIAAFVLGDVWVLFPALVGGLPFGWDAVVYTEAARALMSGDNPWLAQGYAIQYAAPPWSMLPFLPFVGLPDAFVSVAWVAIGIASGLYAVRRLALPWWWLLFPPLVLGVAAGSSAPLVLALLIRGGVLADTGAVLARVYAALPLVLLGRWKSVVASAVALVVTAPFLAVGTYIAERERWMATFERGAADLSALSIPLLIPVTLLGLLVLGRKEAAWLIVPALWPNTQLYYGVIAMPVLGGLPIVALAMAIPVPGLVVGGILAQAAIRVTSPMKAATRADGGSG